LPSASRPLALLVAVTILGACGRESPVVSIGAAGPWKEGFGAMNRRGLEMAVQEINDNGLIRGRTVELVARDDEGDGSTAARVAAEFVANPGIVAVVGHVTSGAMAAAAPLYDDGRLAAVATTATSPDLTGVSPWVFRVISSDSTNGFDLARFAARQGKRRAAIVYENDSYGRGLAESFRRHFQGQVVSLDPIAGDTRDLEPYVSYYRQVAPDIVFVAGTEASGMAMLREARRQNLRTTFLGGDGWTGIVADPDAAEGAFVGAPFSPQDPRPEAQKFVTAFRRKYGRMPDGNAALAYDATMLVARAIDAVGADRERIRDWLAALDEDDAYVGVTGPIRFRPDGDPVGKALVMTRVHDGLLLVEGAR
jgi:branched-chain amino acid transport system substrate-binding protein